MKNFYSYKNKMSEKDLNLEWNIDTNTLSPDSLNEESLEGLDIDEMLETEGSPNLVDNVVSSTNNVTFETVDEWKNTVDESVFLESWDTTHLQKNVLKDWDNFWNYLRWFFFSTLLTLLWVLAIALFYSFRIYLEGSLNPSENSENRKEYIVWFKWKYKRIKDKVWTKVYEAPKLWSEEDLQQVNEIITASDIDYIDKKELLSPYVSDLIRKIENGTAESNNLKQDIAKQWFLPEELEKLLSEDQAIDTIQRSLNALEVIKFSTASKVFSYMNTALQRISEMIRISGANVDTLHNLLEKLNSRWENDIASYVYMCYLNPFEINANCDVVWDLDLYYQLVKDTSIDIKLFKNAMHAISQLLEKEDTSLFSITFNWFNAADKSIQFNIEVYTNQEDERALIAQWKRNPNIFILTNIINLLKQSSFIIWADISPKEINVDTKILNQWWIDRPVNYSTMDFVVPIQKNTEREIFDYIDIESVKKLLSDRWYKDEVDQNNKDIVIEEKLEETSVKGTSIEEISKNSENSEISNENYVE